jgi:hypothetical protein
METLIDFNNREEIDRAIEKVDTFRRIRSAKSSSSGDNRHPYYGLLTNEGRQYYDEVKDAFPVREIYPHPFSGQPKPIVTKDKHGHLWYRMNDFPDGFHGWKQLGDRPIVIIYIRSETDVQQ